MSEPIADRPVLTEAQRQQLSNALRVRRFNAARKHIIRIVDGAPPLTSSQREKLAALLLDTERDQASA